MPPCAQATAFDWQMPVPVHFGVGAVERLPAMLGGDRVVLLVFEGAEAIGLLPRLRTLLGPRLLYAESCPDGLSDLARVRSLCRRLWPVMACRPETVLVAIGGGTVLDLAKMVRCRPASRDIDSLVMALRGEGPWPALHRDRLWLVPTTAGTGSEVTRWATLWDTEVVPPLKRSFDEPFGHAERAFVDPALTLSCPPEVTRNAALDALSHALEAIWNRHANPLSSQIAVGAARRVLHALPRVQAAPEDLGARVDLSLAALEAGIASSQTRTALAHALSYALTLERRMPHGLACASWLVPAWRLAVGRDILVDHHLGRIFDTPASEGAARLAAWLEALGVDPRPQAFGVIDAERRIAEALASARGRNFIGAPD